MVGELNLSSDLTVKAEDCFSTNTQLNHQLCIHLKRL